MAFKATKKSSTKEDVSVASQAVEPTVIMDVNDLIGAPVELPVEADQTPKVSMVEDQFVQAAGPAPLPVRITTEKMEQPSVERSGDNRPMDRPMDRRMDRPTDRPNDGGGYNGNQRYQRRDYGSNNRQGGYAPRPMGRYGMNRYPQSRPPMNGGMNRGYNSPANYPRPNADINMETQDITVPTETVRGILDLMPEGHGFLRPKFTPSDKDVYISQSQIRRFLLRNGDMVEGQARQPKDNERYWGLLKVEKINEVIAEAMQNRPKFDDLTAIYPNRHLNVESGQMPLSTRIIDLVAPIGFGQRALIVSPPKAGKTTILKELAAGISANYPNVHLMAALIGERPEEVTDLTRSIKGEVLASNFDQAPQEQTRVAEVALERAKRLVEMGKDVVVLLDSITRLARAYNLVVNPSGRTLSGGFDPAALYPAKKFLGAARCVEPFVPPGSTLAVNDNSPVAAEPTVASSTEAEKTGGSLTVIGTALVETGSRMDDLIYEEFKGTGNMELHLSRTLQERRVFPAIDVGKSGTRHDELLVGEEAMKRMTTLRHMLSMLGDDERTLMLIDRLGKTKSNAEFLESLSQGV